MLSITEASERMGIHRISLLAKNVRGELKRVALSGRPLLLDDVMVHPSELMSTKFSDTHVVNTELTTSEGSVRMNWRA
ncbi:hypothetical protein AGR13a_Lc30121 [Agrobacterium genomosp. 13 str. CFBP 6927]|uniref:Uncharacterized protein n=1 Tax=Agrobacterium genomosp. 13 str. CFBP 6927 TaxID=1183428 RepID=A0ABM9VLC5_9HYPH|nr:hypothetical protein AGR13a_Lc30121 [Agrobacterium genomosp. 13 str. CFBP 6927]